MTTIEERIDAGVAWLDEQVPDWLDRIDLGRLSLASPCRCVLGQTFAGAVEGESGWDAVVYSHRHPVPHLGLDAAIKCGFDAVHSSAAEYGWLTRRWRERIAALRAERGAP